MKFYIKTHNSSKRTTTGRTINVCMMYCRSMIMVAVVIVPGFGGGDMNYDKNSDATINRGNNFKWPLYVI